MAVNTLYTQGNYAPVAEETTAEDLPVTGTIPPELDGRLLRIGPNPITEANAEAHWFLGSGMAHGVRIADGRAAWYRNRYIVGDLVADTLGLPATPGPKGELGDGNANTNIIEHAGMTLAIVEAGGQPVVLTDELETVERTDFGGTLDGSFTAHPKRHPDTGELHAVVYSPFWESVRYLVVDTEGTVRHKVDVPTGHSPMVHDCAITESAVLLLDFPCHFDLEEAMSGGSFPYRWNPEGISRVGILPFDSPAEAVRWCDVDPCYVFHPLNAFDRPDGTVEATVAVHPSMFNTITNEPDEGPPTFERWILDPETGTTKREQLDERSHEFPRHDERREGKDSRYGYTVPLDGDTRPAFKHDLHTGKVEVHDFGPGRASQEMVFVPRSADADEDDGWCMSYVHDAERDAADVVIVAAQDFTGDPVATIHLPQRVPFGFHGNWVPTA